MKTVVHLVAEEQCFCSAEESSISHSAVPGWVGQLTPLSKRETLNFSLCSATKGRVELAVGSSITQGLSVHRSSCGEQLCCLSIAFFSPC